MKYLMKYGLSEKDLEEIYDSLDDEDWYNIVTCASEISNLLEYFKSIGIINFKEIFLNKPLIFYQNVENMKKQIENSNIEDLIKKINEDARNFELLGF